MKVELHSVEGEFVVADPGGWVPGTYPTPEAAARAAWNMRNHGAPDNLITTIASGSQEDST